MKLSLIFTLLVLGLGLTQGIKISNDLPIQITSQQIWGTYKPQLIHAVSNQSAVPLTFSTMYYNPDKLNKLKDLRYKVAERPSDSIVFNYDYHNGIDFAVQSIRDPLLPINYTTNFFKTISHPTRQQWVDVVANQNNDNTTTHSVNFVYLVSWENFLASPENTTQSIEV